MTGWDQEYDLGLTDEGPGCLQGCLLAMFLGAILWAVIILMVARIV